MAEPPDDPRGDVPAYLEVGRVAKAHGLRGEVIVALVTNRLERVAVGSVLARDASGGGPLTVLAASPHQHRHRVAFAGVTSREAAEALAGTVLYAPPIEDPDEMWVHELFGCEVETVAGERCGRVVGVVANPASDLVELEGGALVPLVFVVSHSPGRLVIDPPPGLLDL